MVKEMDKEMDSDKDKEKMNVEMNRYDEPIPKNPEINPRVHSSIVNVNEIMEKEKERNVTRNSENPEILERTNITDLGGAAVRIDKEEEHMDNVNGNGNYVVNSHLHAGNEAEPVVELTAVAIDATDKKAKSIRQNNTYAAKKTVAQGMMDIALITANANQLRYIVEYQRNSPTFWVLISLIIISLLLQVAIGVSLIFKGRFDMRGESKFAHARRINNYVVSGVFMVTIINVFVAAFSVSPAQGVQPQTPTP